jgi:hypothetical protein
MEFLVLVILVVLIMDSMNTLQKMKKIEKNAAHVFLIVNYVKMLQYVKGVKKIGLKLQIPDLVMKIVNIAMLKM